MNDDEDKGNDKIEDQPDVDHLDVRSCREALVHLQVEYKYETVDGNVWKNQCQPPNIPTKICSDT